MQHAHTSTQVQKKLPVKKKDVGEHRCARLRGKSAPYTRASSYRVYHAAGTPRALQEKVPRTYSTYPHPVLNDDDCYLFRMLEGFFMSEFSVVPLVPLFSLPSAASMVPEVALCAPALCLDHQGKLRVLSGMVDTQG